jgi:hypothetical protein
MARDDAERKIELLIRDIQLAVGDIAGIGAESGTETAEADSQKSLTPTTESTIRAREITKRSQPALSTRREGERKAKPIGWVSLQNRFQELYSRWTEARRSAKAAVFLTISVHPSVTSASKINRNKESQRPPTSLRSQDDFAGSRTPSARRSTTAKSTTRSIKSAPLARIEERSSFPTIQLSQILGVSPAQSTGRCQDEVGDSLLSVALDLSRVHLLQQDLVNFSRVAFEFSHQIRSLMISTPPAQTLSYPIPRQNLSMNQSLSVITEDLSFDSSVHSSQATLPLHSNFLPHGESAHTPSLQITTDSLLSYEESLNSLRVHSRTLLLHLSCMAPLAPLSMGKSNGKNLQSSVGSYMPLSSSQTGLDLFIEMMIEILEPRKLFTPAIQRVMDRSKSEQVNLLNSLHIFEKTTQQQVRYGQESHETLKKLSRSLNEIFKGTIKELHQLQQSLTTISHAWLVCEQARIPMPSVNQPGISPPLVSPVEILGRGYLGEEMAAFANTLRLYKQDLQHLTDNLNALRKKLVHDFNSSVIHSILICYQKLSELFPPPLPVS